MAPSPAKKTAEKSIENIVVLPNLICKIKITEIVDDAAMKMSRKLIVVRLKIGPQAMSQRRACLHRLTIRHNHAREKSVSIVRLGRQRWDDNK